VKYSIHSEAEQDLRSAAQFYREQAGPALALALLTEIEHSISLLMRHPHIGAPWRGNKRRYVMRRFPYSVVYEFAPDEIRVLAVAHQSRRPDYWRGRN